MQAVLVFCHFFFDRFPGGVRRLSPAARVLHFGMAYILIIASTLFHLLTVGTNGLRTYYNTDPLAQDKSGEVNRLASCEVSASGVTPFLPSSSAKLAAVAPFFVPILSIHSFLFPVTALTLADRDRSPPGHGIR